MAASYYGLPRTTLDVDFIVQLSNEQLDPFLDKLAGFGLEVDRTRIKRRLRAGYNIVTLRDKASQNRVDFIIQTTGKIHRRPGRALGLKSFYQSPEALILAKLRMIKATHPPERSFKDRDDIRQILANIKISRRKLFRLAEEQHTGAFLKEILELS
ncbi:hypothetical protein AUH73_06640 [archaeon 13_1_40CM_4_53_4]|nr:MAG: hypothetical protein AUH73_06640 [archaeon 13_1_40CM_4_53_4]OLE59270.1 MAG: hypothetical protein AUG17_03775 [Crenarchaeota archaeon 13_1_20CM_2_53_14]TLY35420.1 MAG: hypothetical protein E6K61_13530 [Nitrospirota bacterium]